MKYYHVNQGFTSEEATLGIYCRNPLEAARCYLNTLIRLGEDLGMPIDGTVRANAPCYATDLDDLYYCGCFVVDRQSGAAWHVRSIDGMPVAKKIRKSAEK